VVSTRNIAQALNAVAAHPPHNPSADELVVAMSDLATIAELLGRLTIQTRDQLAAWATVSAHLQYDEQQAADLSRTFHHVAAIYAFDYLVWPSC
jgi:hypothetical protein